MSGPAAALLAVILAAPASASDPRLGGVHDPEPGSWRGLALSLGPGRPVCGRATFDRRKAAAGGRILVVDAAEPGDEDAVRMSEALVARRGGLSSRAALAARRHGVPAVALGRGAWDPAGPSLTLSEPAFGPASAAGAVVVRAAAGARERALREGDAVCVDPASARVILPAPDEADARVAAAEAARAYDGLRDAGALERWLAAEPGPARAAALTRELIPRAFEGGVPPADFARLVRACRAAAGASGREALLGVERRVYSRSARALRAELSACPSSAADAPSAETLDRLASQARSAAERAAQAGRALGAGDGGAPALARACADAAARRRKAVPAESPALEAAARAAGADLPESIGLPADAWGRFVSENGLAEFLASTLDDASLGLRRKSARVRERILAARLDPASEAGRAAVAAAAGPVRVVGEDATLESGPADVLDKVKEVWAASWSAGPLGVRLRAGRSYEGRVRVEKAVAAEMAGLAFSRDPGSGLRGRVIVEAVKGGEPVSLSPARLRRLSRLTRALDAWRGAGVEVSFSFAGEKLLVHSARALEAPEPPRPVQDPFSPRPEGLSLPVRNAR